RSVRGWGSRLAPLTQWVGWAEPRPIVWENIRTAVGHAEPQAPIVLPEAPPAMSPPSVDASEPVAQLAPVVDNSNVIRLSRRVRRWRSLATATTAIAAALVAMI